MDEIKQDILTYDLKKNRRPTVSMVVVTKNRQVALVHELYKNNCRAFAESYVQEAVKKIESLAHLTGLEWHYIGKVQRNKTRQIAEKFQWVQTVTNELIATRLAKQRPIELAPLNICIQVNPTNDASRNGIGLHQVELLGKHIMQDPQLRWRGVMFMAPAALKGVELKVIYKRVQKCYNELAIHYDIDTLSMGVSSDYQVAITHGANLVRIGRYIFEHDMPENQDGSQYI